MRSVNIGQNYLNKEKRLSYMCNRSRKIFQKTIRMTPLVSNVFCQRGAYPAVSCSLVVCTIGGMLLGQTEFKLVKRNN